jgi:hypothetical protein
MEKIGKSLRCAQYSCNRESIKQFIGLQTHAASLAKGASYQQVGLLQRITTTRCLVAWATKDPCITKYEKDIENVIQFTARNRKNDN